MSTGYALAVAGAMLIGVALVSPSLRGGPPSDGARANMTVAAPAGRPARAADPAPLLSAPRTLSRGPDGHFYAEARVNGMAVRFMVDTGASVVVLTPADARRAGVRLPAERALAMGAGGPIEVTPVTIDRLVVGGIEARGVAGAVAQNLPVSLLGQSYLSQLGSVEIRGDVMVLR